MKLEVGEFYLNSIGETIKIEDKHDDFIFLIKDEYFFDASENSYFENGKVTGDSREFDLIAHIPKELHKHILNEINSYYTDKDFKEVVDSVWVINEDNIRV